jgi:NitT/TauT family transport system permease protein
METVERTSAAARPAIPVRPRPRPEAWVLLGSGSLLAAWTALSAVLGPQALPSPWDVLQVMGAGLWSGALPFHVGRTLGRVALSTTLAMGLGGVAGVWVGLSTRADLFWSPYVLTGLVLPRVLLIVVCYLLLGLNEVALVVATTLSVAPGVAVAVQQGVRSLDWGLVDMARAFGVPALERWRRCVAPQLLPYAAGALRNATSLSFKMVLFAELMGRPDGVGYQIAFYFQMFNMLQILAYGLATVLVAGALEFGLRRVEDRLFRWRPVRP